MALDNGLSSDICTVINSSLGNGLSVNWPDARNQVQTLLTMMQSILCASNAGVVPSGTARYQFVQIGFPDGVPTPAAAPVLFVQEGIRVWTAANTGSNDLGVNPAVLGTGTAWQLVGSGTEAIGTIKPWPGLSATVPPGWFECYGQEVSQTTYSALYSVLGNAWGSAGAGNFKLPDMRYRTWIGTDNMGGSAAGRGTQGTPNTLGSTIGAEKHQLTVAELASHVHQTYTGAGSTNSGFGSANRTTPLGNAEMQSAGGDIPHNNMQPSALGLWIIKYA